MTLQKEDTKWYEVNRMDPGDELSTSGYYHIVCLLATLTSEL